MVEQATPELTDIMRHAVHDQGANHKRRYRTQTRKCVICTESIDGVPNAQLHAHHDGMKGLYFSEIRDLYLIRQTVRGVNQNDPLFLDDWPAFHSQLVKYKIVHDACNLNEQAITVARGKLIRLRKDLQQLFEETMAVE